MIYLFRIEKKKISFSSQFSIQTPQKIVISVIFWWWTRYINSCWEIKQMLLVVNSTWKGHNPAVSFWKYVICEMAWQQKQTRTYWGKRESKYRVSPLQEDNTFGGERSHCLCNIWLSMWGAERFIQTDSHRRTDIMFLLHASHTANSVYFSFLSRWRWQAATVEQQTSLGHSCHGVSVASRWPVLCCQLIISVLHHSVFVNESFLIHTVKNQQSWEGPLTFIILFVRLLSRQFMYVHMFVCVHFEGLTLPLWPFYFREHLSSIQLIWFLKVVGKLICPFLKPHPLQDQGEGATVQKSAHEAGVLMTLMQSYKHCSQNTRHWNIELPLLHQIQFEIKH